jgi:tyrosyl-tRNA synthetase
VTASEAATRRMAPVDEQLSVLLSGVEYGDDRTHATMEAELRERLEEDRPLKVYAGFDPTSVDLHLGHTLPMRKLRQFQDFGHEVTFLIGNFTGLVGDPSDKDKGRPMLTAEMLAENGRTYADQAFRILDGERTTVRYNADWLGKLGFAEILNLTSKFTVAQFLERDNFSKRWQNHDAIHLSEFMYAIMQAYDAVMLETDVQVGGSDQLFNLMAGRTLQRDAGQRPQVVITLPILVGTDGTQRMSKSTGNSIGINEVPNDMYGKVMSLPDDVIPRRCAPSARRSMATPSRRWKRRSVSPARSSPCSTTATRQQLPRNTSRPRSSARRRLTRCRSTPSRASSRCTMSSRPRASPPATGRCDASSHRGRCP